MVSENMAQCCYRNSKSFNFGGLSKSYYNFVSSRFLLFTDGKVQSKIQIFSLILPFTSACIIEKLTPFRKSKNSKEPTKSEENVVHGQGVIAVLRA